MYRYTKRKYANREIGNVYTDQVWPSCYPYVCGRSCYSAGSVLLCGPALQLDRLDTAYYPCRHFGPVPNRKYPTCGIAAVSRLSSSRFHYQTKMFLQTTLVYTMSRKVSFSYGDRIDCRIYYTHETLWLHLVVIFV